MTGILVQGSNGEAQHLSHAERTLAIQTTRKTLDSNGFQNVVVIAGTGAQSTRETIELCKEAADAGATHALVLTASTWAPIMTKDKIIIFHRTVSKNSNQSIVQSYRLIPQVADGSPIPIMIYNFPVVTSGLDLDSDTIATLAEHPNIVGTKLSCGNIGKLSRLSSSFPQERFAVFPGRSDVFTPALLCGGAGLIGASVNLVPKIHNRLYALWKEGKTEEAMKLQMLLAHSDWAVGKLGGIAGLKGLVSTYFGYGEGRVRSPLVAVAPEKLKDLQDAKLLEVIELEKSMTI